MRNTPESSGVRSQRSVSRRCTCSNRLAPGNLKERSLQMVTLLNQIFNAALILAVVTAVVIHADASTHKPMVSYHDSH
jgi:hypothetical protein